MIVDKRDYADLFSFCLTERFIIKEITSYSVSDRFGSRRVALFANHMVKCSKKLWGMDTLILMSSSSIHVLTFAHKRNFASIY